MPLNQPPLPLATGPRSVQEARRWAEQSCRRLGRGDLVECAQSGISELVTNAILHGSDPISVRMRGTRGHPRIEVFDRSRRPPVPNPRMARDDELLSTVGRGLGIVAMCSSAWGADLQDDGKLVWFEPLANINESPTYAGHLFGFDNADDHRPPPSGGRPRVDVCLEKLPVALYADFWRHLAEVHRELRLLSLAHERDYPIAKSLAERFSTFEEEHRTFRATSTLDAAIDQRTPTVDVAFEVSRETPALMTQMLDLLELADAFCRSERLLALATTPQQRTFHRWYLGEFVRQSRGERPTAWAGRHLSQSTS